MQWTNGEASGFTSGQPWIDIAPNYKEVNVEQAIEDDHSVFHMYRRLIDLRHNHDILTYGDITPLYMTHDQLLFTVVIINLNRGF